MQETTARREAVPVFCVPFYSPESERTIHVEEGDVYEFLLNVGTRAGFTHLAGSRIFVVRKTREAPHNEVGPRGCNWVCQTIHDTSVWATLEHCIERGLLHRIATGMRVST